MSYALTAVTPTRDRPEAIALCTKWMSRQTFKKPVQWILVDDGDVPVTPFELTAQNIKLLYLRRPPSTAVSTLQDNLLHAIPWIDGSGVVFIEDDEFYAPTYLEAMAEMLEGADLAGERAAHYYNVASRRWFLPENQRHASLCRTGVRRSLVGRLHEVCVQSKDANDVFVDLRLWGMNGHPPASLSTALRPWSGLSVGIKGMPGRGGLGKSHGLMSFPHADPKMEVLRQWIGDDAKEYERFFVGGK